MSEANCLNGLFFLRVYSEADSFFYRFLFMLNPFPRTALDFLRVNPYLQCDWGCTGFDGCVRDLELQVRTSFLRTDKTYNCRFRQFLRLRLSCVIAGYGLCRSERSDILTLIRACFAGCPVPARDFYRNTETTLAALLPFPDKYLAPLNLQMFPVLSFGRGFNSPHLQKIRQDRPDLPPKRYRLKRHTRFALEYIFFNCRFFPFFQGFI